MNKYSLFMMLSVVRHFQCHSIYHDEVIEIWKRTLKYIWGTLCVLVLTVELHLHLNDRCVSSLYFSLPQHCFYDWVDYKKKNKFWWRFFKEPCKEVLKKLESSRMNSNMLTVKMSACKQHITHHKSHDRGREDSTAG